MAAVVQMDAAVVSPRTVRPSLKMTPAPRKPMPVMMPWAIRVGSMRTASLTVNHWPWSRVTSIKHARRHGHQGVGPEPGGAAVEAALHADDPAGGQRGQHVLCEHPE